MNSQLSTQVGHPAESVHSFAKHTEESLASYLELISHQRWLIICVALLVSLCGVLYAYLAAPQYESNLLVHVEEKGQREPKNILGEAGSMIDYKTPSAAEIELLRSRQVIARAVDRLKLYVEVKPKRLLIVGNALSAIGITNYFPALQSVGGYQRLHFLWGHYDYKKKMGAKPVELYRLLILKNLSKGLLHPLILGHWYWNSLRDLLRKCKHKYVFRN